MKKHSTKIDCPNCGHQIDVNDLLYNQVSDELEKNFDAKLAEERKSYEKQMSRLNKQKAKFESDKNAYEEKLLAAIQEGVKAEKKKLKKDLKTQIEEEQSEQVKSLQDELKEKTGQIKELNKTKADLERLKREKEEIKVAIEVKSEKKMNDLLVKEREKLEKLADQKSEFKVLERDKIIEQLNDQLKEAQRKAVQGSMQLQGEVMELAIEDWLADYFPLDTIEEIKKGARGADCLQIVNTRTRQNCGSIYYESKRTKAFQPSWIEKFKSDIRERNADIGILVTETMPNDMVRFGQKDGIWICNFDEFKGLSVVLRESIISLSNAIATQENKGDKMGMLYSYLTSNEFKLEIEAIVEGFTQMRSDLESEKRSLNGIWKKREKQIDKVLLNTTHMYSSIKGIAGNAIQTVQLLELPSDEDEVDDD
ncbi:MAG: DUF2130 domain-containing protein [bacterium]